MPRKISVPIPTQNSGSRRSCISASLRLDRRDSLRRVLRADRHTDQPLHDLSRGFGGSDPDSGHGLAALAGNAPFGDCERILRFGVCCGFQAIDLADNALSVFVGKLMGPGPRLRQGRLIGSEFGLRLFAYTLGRTEMPLDTDSPLADYSLY